MEIIEKKHEKIDYTKVKIPCNYVLVLPDKNFTTYQLKGQETGIHVGISIERDMAKDELEGKMEERVNNSSQHWSVRGKVFAVCEKLNYPKEEIKRARKSFGMDTSSMKYIKEMVDKSVDYETDIEVEKGDEVVFDYLSHMASYEEGSFIETDLGDMYLMRYDSLTMAIKPSGEYKPLNGWVIIEKKEPERKTESGLIIPILKKETDKIGKYGYGEVLCAGIPNRSYKANLDLSDDPYPLKKGDRVVYRPGGSRPIEWILHQTVFPGVDTVAIMRKDIFFVEDGR